jgi:hypothetical protein
MKNKLFIIIITILGIILLLLAAAEGIYAKGFSSSRSSSSSRSFSRSTSSRSTSRPSTPKSTVKTVAPKAKVATKTTTKSKVTSKPKAAPKKTTAKNNTKSTTKTVTHVTYIQHNHYSPVGYGGWNPFGGNFWFYMWIFDRPQQTVVAGNPVYVQKPCYFRWYAFWTWACPHEVQKDTQSDNINPTPIKD